MVRGEAERTADASSPSIVSMAKLSLATKRIACHWPSLRPEPGGNRDKRVSFQFKSVFRHLQVSQHFLIHFWSAKRGFNHPWEPTTFTLVLSVFEAVLKTLCLEEPRALFQPFARMLDKNALLARRLPTSGVKEIKSKNVVVWLESTLLQKTDKSFRLQQDLRKMGVIHGESKVRGWVLKVEDSILSSNMHQPLPVYFLLSHRRFVFLKSSIIALRSFGLALAL